MGDLYFGETMNQIQPYAARQRASHTIHVFTQNKSKNSNEPGYSKKSPWKKTQIHPQVANRDMTKPFDLGDPKVTLQSSIVWRSRQDRKVAESGSKVLKITKNSHFEA